MNSTDNVNISLKSFLILGGMMLFVTGTAIMTHSQSTHDTCVTQPEIRHIRADLDRLTTAVEMFICSYNGHPWKPGTREEDVGECNEEQTTKGRPPVNLPKRRPAADDGVPVMVNGG